MGIITEASFVAALMSAISASVLTAFLAWRREQRKTDVEAISDFVSVSYRLAREAPDLFTIIWKWNEKTLSEILQSDDRAELISLLDEMKSAYVSFWGSFGVMRMKVRDRKVRSVIDEEYAKVKSNIEEWLALDFLVRGMSLMVRGVSEEGFPDSYFEDWSETSKGEMKKIFGGRELLPNFTGTKASDTEKFAFSAGYVYWLIPITERILDVSRRRVLPLRW